jgi:hypothetical protein
MASGEQSVARLSAGAARLGSYIGRGAVTGVAACSAKEKAPGSSEGSNRAEAPASGQLNIGKRRHRNADAVFHT